MKTLLLTFSIIFSLISVVEAQHKYSIHSEISISSMQNNKLSDGGGILFNFRRTISEKWGADVGFSFNQSLNTVRSDDPSVIRNPEKIREGYLYTSLDLFAGAVYEEKSESRLSFPVGAGLILRNRTETFQNSDTEINARNSIVLANPNYEQSVDYGLYLLISASFSPYDKWSFGIQSRHQFYTRGFSMFNLGISARHHF